MTITVVRRGIPPTVVVSFAVVVTVLSWSVVPGLFTSQDPANGVPADKFLGPSGGHWFGTDHLGRDLFSRVVHGTASSVTSALIAVGIAVLVGGLVGLVAGFLGGWTDTVLARLVDVLLAIPEFLLADTVSVMHRGRIVESGPVRAVFDDPREPYTRTLVESIPAGV